MHYSRKDVERLEQHNAFLRAAMCAHRAGDLTYEEALLLAVVETTKAEEIARDALVAEVSLSTRPRFIPDQPASEYLKSLLPTLQAEVASCAHALQQKREQLQAVLKGLELEP